MKNILRGIGIMAALLVGFMLLTSCAPGKAQTRTTNDGAAAHNFDGDRQPAVKSGYTSDEETYSSSDDFDIENNDIDAAAEPKQSASKPAVKSAAPKKTAAKKPAVEESADAAETDEYAAEEKPAACTAKAPRTKAADETVGTSAADDAYFQKGIASWYGREFHGRKTASGEKFNMNEMTAAHKTLPLGSVVLVKNLDNGKIVKVRINDRGPYKGKRILDLSYAAAKRIDMLGEGEAMVGIKVIGSGSQAYAGDSSDLDQPAAGMTDDEEKPAVKSKAPSGGSVDGYAIQTGAFLSKRNAEKLRDHLAETFPDNEVVVYSDGDLFKVQVKGIASKSEAEKYKRTLGKENISAFTVHQE